MWLWLLSLLFDQTVTTENTRCLTILGPRFTPLLGRCHTIAMTSSIDIQEHGVFFFRLNHMALLCPVYWQEEDYRMSVDVDTTSGSDSFSTHCLPSSLVLLLNFSASVKGNLLPRVWRLLNEEWLQNCQSLLYRLPW